MIIKSTRFGDIDVVDDGVLQFPHGVPGFTEEKVFVFLPYQPDSPFAFLQSLNDPDLTFVIVEPFTFFADYNFDIDSGITDELGICHENPPRIFNVVRVPEKIDEMTVNLLAPIIVNWEKRIAIQYVLEKTSYPVRQRIFPNGIAQQTDKKEG